MLSFKCISLYIIYVYIFFPLNSFLNAEDIRTASKSYLSLQQLRVSTTDFEMLRCIPFLHPYFFSGKLFVLNFHFLLCKPWQRRVERCHLNWYLGSCSMCFGEAMYFSAPQQHPENGQLCITQRKDFWICMACLNSYFGQADQGFSAEKSQV